MTLRDALLDAMFRDDLALAANRLGVQVSAGARVGALRTQLKKSRVATAVALAAYLPTPRLMAVCANFGMPHRGPRARILAALRDQQRVGSERQKSEPSRPLRRPKRPDAKPVKDDVDREPTLKEARRRDPRARNPSKPKPEEQGTSPTRPMIDLDKLLKLRIAVARYGELDAAGWWNTRGQLGKLGASVLRRGFPRTYRFAEARSVFAVAGHRCEEVFHPPGSVTLWHLPAALEEEFDARWESWLDNATDWEPFFANVEMAPTVPLADWLRNLCLLSQAASDTVAKLKRTAEGRAVALSPRPEVSDVLIEVLAAAFSKGEPGALAVPYVSLAA